MRRCYVRAIHHFAVAHSLTHQTNKFEKIKFWKIPKEKYSLKCGEKKTI